jgi:hypothetical protein
LAPKCGTFVDKVHVENINAGNHLANFRPHGNRLGDFSAEKARQEKSNSIIRSAIFTRSKKWSIDNKSCQMTQTSHLSSAAGTDIGLLVLRAANAFFDPLRQRLDDFSTKRRNIIRLAAAD